MQFLSLLCCDEFYYPVQIRHNWVLSSVMMKFVFICACGDFSDAFHERAQAQGTGRVVIFWVKFSLHALKSENSCGIS